MSWQGYVDNLLATKHTTHCGIFGLDGSPWASSPGFPINADGIKQIVGGINDVSRLSNGVNAAGERYILVRSDPGESVMLKKGLNGIVAYKSSQCVIVALHDSSVKAETTLNSVGKVIDYLSKNGY